MSTHTTPQESEPLLSGPSDADIKLDPARYVRQFIGNTAFVLEVQEYINPAGRLYKQVQIFEWWFSRVIDRLDHKMDKNIELDLHENVIWMLQDQLSDMRKTGCRNKEDDYYPIINYFATHVAPLDGFTAEQIKEAKRYPKHWERRDKKEGRVHERRDKRAKLSDKEYAIQHRRLAIMRHPASENQVEHNSVLGTNADDGTDTEVGLDRAPPDNDQWKRT
jgi:hypothetical protein